MTAKLSVLIVFFFLISGGQSLAQEAEPQGETAPMSDSAADNLEVEINVLEDGTEEQLERGVASSYASALPDERYLIIQRDAQQQIDAVLEQIRQLENRDAEGELHKQIEQIKINAEIERLAVLKEDAEIREDYELADELSSEIDRLERFDQPTIGTPQEQQPQQTRD